MVLPLVIVKVAPLLPELARAGITCDVAFTGSRPAETDSPPGEMTFLGLAIPEPKWFLDIGAATDAVTIGRALEGFEAIFAEDRPDAVMVVGDLSATLAAALAAVKANLPVIHLQAGFRCGDMSVPEEVNRVLTDQVADLLFAPTRTALAKAGLAVADLDVVELNEAFASQSLAVVQELGIPAEKLNPNGGAIALGHPLGCSGARILTTLLYELRRQGGRYGLATMCIGVGQGISLIIQNSDI